MNVDPVSDHIPTWSTASLKSDLQLKSKHVLRVDDSSRLKKRSFSKVIRDVYDDSEPEPDISVSARSTGLEHPSTSLLMIEVSDSSIRKDREVKSTIYAEAGVGEYWIVDISGSELAVEVQTGPTERGYRRVEILRDGDVLRPTQLPAVALPVGDIPWNR